MRADSVVDLLPLRMIQKEGSTSVFTVSPSSMVQLPEMRDGGRISHPSHPWRLGHWFSSGLSDQRAAAARRPICEGAARQASAGSVAWLRRLHRSHRPRREAFCFCVHRPEAATLSYTEILCCRSLRITPCTARDPCEQRAGGGHPPATGSHIAHWLRQPGAPCSAAPEQGSPLC
jgi:hypothetical protein